VDAARERGQPTTRPTQMDTVGAAGAARAPEGICMLTAEAAAAATGAGRDRAVEEGVGGVRTSSSP